MSLVDYDDLECRECGHIGMMPDGGFDVECPVCGAGYSLTDEDCNDLECMECGHRGMQVGEDNTVECPVCGAECELGDFDYQDEDDSEDYDDED